MKQLRSFLSLACVGLLLCACSDSGYNIGTATLTIVGGNSQTAAAGDTLAQPLSVKVASAEGVPLRGVTVQWTVTAGGGTVTSHGPTSQLGIATAQLKVGNVLGYNTVTAALGSTTVTFNAVGVTGPPAVVKISRDSFVTRVLGDTVRLSATVTDKLGNAVDNATVLWSSSDTTIASVASTGLLTVRGRGNATITAKSSTVQGTMPVRVVTISRVVATPDTIRFRSVGQTAQITVAALDAAGVNLSPFTATFTSLAPAVASVAANGLVSGVANGNALVVVDVEGHRDTVLVNVTQVIKLASVSPARVFLPVTTTVQLNGLALDSLGNAVPGIPFTFQSADSTIAKVTATGTATGVRIGSTTATAVNGSFTANGEIVVTALLANVTAGPQHTCALATTGPTVSSRAYCWGQQAADTRLGTETHASINVPSPVYGTNSFVSIDAGGFHTCARVAGGLGACWGDNTYGQLGDGTMAMASDPVAVSGPLFSSISAGWKHTCGLAVTDGRAYCWGYGTDGQLGIGVPVLACNAQPCAITPTVVSGGLTFTRISAGLAHTCAIEATTKNAYCWGDNQFGELGNGTTTSSNVPVLVSTTATFNDISAGDYFTCGVTTDARLLCWGRNDSYQLGIGTQANNSNPMQLNPPATGFVEVSAGGMHACARNSANNLYCWGANTYGQIGNDSNTAAQIPMQVLSSATFISVTTGHDHTCATSSGNLLFCWGLNTDGQLGTGDNTNRKVPTQVH